MHSTQTGVSDHIASSERHAAQLTRSIVANLSTKSFYKDNSFNKIQVDDPLYDADSLTGVIGTNHSMISMRAVLARTLDGSRFHEFKEKYGSTLVTGFGHLYGHPVGIVGN